MLLIAVRDAQLLQSLLILNLHLLQFYHHDVFCFLAVELLLNMRIILHLHQLIILLLQPPNLSFQLRYLIFQLLHFEVRIHRCRELGPPVLKYSHFVDTHG